MHLITIGNTSKKPKKRISVPNSD